MYQRRKARVLLVVLILIALVLITVDFRSGDGGDGPLDRLRGGVTAVVRPIQDGIATLVRPIGDAVGGVTDIFSVRSENERLQARLDVLEERFRSLEDLERENEELRQLLGIRERAELVTVGARTVAFGASDFEWVITIDAGSEDGIERGMPVINGDGLVGRIVQVTPNASRVLLTIDPTFQVAVRTASTGETGTVAGRGGEPLVFSVLDPEADLEVGDELVTSSYDSGQYPEGIPIGIVAEVGEATTSLVREVTVRPFVDFTRLHQVLVVIDAPLDPLPAFRDSDDLEVNIPDVDPFVDQDDLQRQAEEDAAAEREEDDDSDPEGEGEGSEDGDGGGDDP
ncbi:rod shape-determining protein MreC [Nitriliruptor alkaliphilus]|uniref:rod shape-determining protein MreC n=1 Tax=Nitriliruptor alkaliphilus TaxID=427918 RepID=UPI0006977ED3|nr:rod shape-determining protein MreC [Nitriliruptor alkaliphilus]